MNESQISVRYAKALFKSAVEQKILDSVNKDMDLLAETCKLDDFQYMLSYKFNFKYSEASFQPSINTLASPRTLLIWLSLNKYLRIKSSCSSNSLHKTMPSSRKCFF